MSDLSFIHSLPSEFTGYYLVPANNRYPCTWGYTSTKEIYHLIQLIGGGQYLFVVTDKDYNYLGHSDNFTEANKLGQEYKKPVAEMFDNTTQSQALITAFDLNSSQVKDLVKGQVPDTFSNWFIICSTEYTAKYGDKYQILAICDDTTCKTSTMFLDVICDDNFNYVTLGSENYNQTLEIANRHSLIADVDRFLTLT